MGLVLNMLMIWTMSLIGIALVNLLLYHSFQLAYLSFLTQLEWILPVMSGLSGFLVGYKKADFWTGLSIVVLIALWIVSATGAPGNMIVFAIGLVAIYLANVFLGHWGRNVRECQRISLKLIFGIFILSLQSLFFFLFAGYSSLSPYSLFNPRWFWTDDTYNPEHLLINASGKAINPETGQLFSGVRFHYDGNLRLDFWTRRPKGIEYFIEGERFGTSAFAESPNSIVVWDITKHTRPETFYLDKDYPQTVRGLFGHGYITYVHFGEGEAPHHFVGLTGLAYETTLAPKLERNSYYTFNGLTKKRGVPYFSQPPDGIRPEPPRLTDWHYRPYVIVIEAKAHQLVKTILTFYPNGVVASAVQDWADSTGWHEGQRLIFNSLGERYADRPFNIKNYAATNFVATDFVRGLSPNISEVRNPIVHNPRLGFFPSPGSYTFTPGLMLNKLLAAYRVPIETSNIFYKAGTKWYPLDKSLGDKFINTINYAQLVGVPLIGARGIDQYQTKSQAYYFYDAKTKRGLHFYWNQPDGMILIENGPYFLMLPKNHVEGTLVDDQLLLRQISQAIHQRHDTKSIRESVTTVYQERCDQDIHPIQSDRFKRLLAE